MQVELISTIPTTSNNTSAIVPICDEFQQRREHIIQELIDEYNKNSERDCYFYKDLTIEEYNKMIDKYNNDISNEEDANIRELYEKELSYIIRDKNRQLEFKNKIARVQYQFNEYHSKPIDTNMRDIIDYIREYNQELLDNIFECFDTTITACCKSAIEYKSVIRSVYASKQSRKVIQIFTSLTDTLIKDITNLFNRFGSNEIYSHDIKMYNRLMKLFDKININLHHFYSRDIYYCIADYMETFPDCSLDFVDIDKKLTEKERNETKALLIKQYITTQLIGLNNYIINELSHKLHDMFIERFNNIMKNKFLCSILNSNNSIVFDDDNTLLSNADNAPLTVKDINTFIDTIPNELVDIATLTKQYNNYLNTSITSRSLGMMLSKSNKLEKQITFNEGKRVINYKHK